MRLQIGLAVVGVAALVGGLRAQGVPYGEHIVSVFQNVTSSTTGLVLVDRAANSCKSVNGLSQTAQEANAVQIDPVNETVWLGTLTNAQLFRVSIDANCNVVAETSWGSATSTASTTAGIQAIAFDRNGNPLAAVAGNPGGNGDGVWSFARNTAGAATLIQPVSGINALCTDPAGNVYYGVAGTGSIFMMAVQPDCTYGSPMLLGTITPASNSATISGLDYCPPTNELWWTSFGTNGSSVGSFGLPNGPAATSTTGLPALNAIEFDVMQKDLTVVTAGTDPDTVFSVSKSFATSTECVIGNTGVPSGIDTCDCTTAETLVVPRCVKGGTIFPLEFGTCCPPGMLAGVFLTQPLALPILVTTAPASGRIGRSFPVKTLPPGTPPGILTFQSACLDQATNKLVIGAPVPWPDLVN